MLCIIIFLYLPYKISWSSCTNRSINNRLKYNYFVQSFTMSTEICLPEGLIELNPSRFLSHLKSLSDVDEGGSDHQHAFISFACTSTKTLYWYNMKNMIMLSITSRIFVIFSSYSQSSFINRRKIYSTYMQIPFLRKYISIFLYKNHLNFFYFWEGGGFSH